METNNQVPEAVPSADKQLEWLHGQLVSSQAFKCCRGNFGWSENCQYMVWRLMRDEPTPTVFAERLRLHLGSVRVMGELYYKLHRMGWMVAADELRDALGSDYVLLTHEDVAVERRVPFTLIMFEPGKTLAMLHWIFSHRLDDTDLYVGTRKGKGEPTAATRALFSAFPTLAERAKSRYKEHNGGDAGLELWAAHKNEVLDHFNIPNRAMPMGLHRNYQDSLMETQGRGGGNSGMTHPFAFLVRQMDQAAVLKWFSRETQARIATWQFDIPAMFKTWDTHEVAIGIHEEGEHAEWKRTYPAFASKGVSNGKGALIVPIYGTLAQKQRYMKDTNNPQLLGQDSPRIIFGRSYSGAWDWDEDKEKYHIS